MNILPKIEIERTPAFSVHTREVASDGAGGWAIADAAVAAADRGENVVSLCLGDTSFDTPHRIVEAAVDSLRGGRTHYSPVPGTSELRSEIAAAQTRSDGGNWSADEATVFAGAQNALFAALMCVAGPGDEVLYFEPWYATYEAVIRVSGALAKPVPIEMTAVSGKIDRSSLDLAVTPRTRAILLNSPNNPGGYAFDHADLMTIVNFAEERDLWIISDEVYRSAVFDGRFLSVASLGARHRTIIVNSLSKSHAMTGWRVGWTLAPPTASAHLQNLAQCMLFGSPTFVQDAAAVALRQDGDQEMTFFAGELRKRRDMMCDHLDEIATLKYLRPAGGMFCFVDISETGMSCMEFAERLFRDERLAIVPGSSFGPNMQSYVRISYSGSIEDINEGMTRLKSFCGRL